MTIHESSASDEPVDRAELVEAIAAFISDSDDELEVPKHMAKEVAANPEILAAGLEKTGGVIDDSVATGMGRLLRAARAINGLNPPQRPPTPVLPYKPTDQQGFAAAKQSNRSTRA